MLHCRIRLFLAWLNHVVPLLGDIDIRVQDGHTTLGLSVHERGPGFEKQCTVNI